MAFATAFKSEVTPNLVPGAKGALGHRTTSNPVLDANNKLLQASIMDDVKRYLDPILRNQSPELIHDLIVTTFNKRSIRVGEGFRDVFYKMIVYIYDNGFPETVTALIEQIPHVGFFRDYWNIIKYINTQANPTQDQKTFFNHYNPLIIGIVNAFWRQIDNDYIELKSNASNPNLSWAGKYAPRQGGSEDKNIYWYFQLENGRLYKQSLVYYLVRMAQNNTNLRSNPTSKMPTPALRLYRTTMASLTSALNVPEVKQAANRYSDIKFEQTTSKFLNKQRKALLNEQLKIAPSAFEEETGNRHPNNPDRVQCRENYLTFMVNKALKTSTVEPHRLLQQIQKAKSNAERKVIEAQWKTIVESTRKMVMTYHTDLLEKIETEHGRESEEYRTAEATPPRPILPMIDVSPSMTTPAGSGFSCMDVSMALGILASDILEGPFKNMALTFSSEPHLLHFVHSDGREYTLLEKVENLKQTVGYTTDLMKAMRKVHEIVVTHNVPDGEIPDLVIFSDEGFDSQVNIDTNSYSYSYSNPYSNQKNTNPDTRWNTTIDNIDNLWIGRKTPFIYFWNLSSNSRGYQVNAVRRGTSILQGFNGSSFKFILTGNLVLLTQEKDPYPNQDTNTQTGIKEKNALDDFYGMINQSYYDPIRVILNNSKEGVLKEYSFNPEEQETSHPTNTEETVDNGWMVLGC
jgi:hypothetical protein